MATLENTEKWSSSQVKPQTAIRNREYGRVAQATLTWLQDNKPADVWLEKLSTLFLLFDNWNSISNFQFWSLTFDFSSLTFWFRFFEYDFLISDFSILTFRYRLFDFDFLISWFWLSWFRLIDFDLLILTTQFWFLDCHFSISTFRFQRLDFDIWFKFDFNFMYLCSKFSSWYVIYLQGLSSQSP